MSNTNILINKMTIPMNNLFYNNNNANNNDNDGNNSSNDCNNSSSSSSSSSSNSNDCNNSSSSSNNDNNELIYTSGKHDFIVTCDYAHINWDKHVLLVCPYDKNNQNCTNVVVTPPMKYIHQTSDNKKCVVKKSKMLTLLETNMEVCSTNVVFGKKNITIFFGKLMYEEQEYQMISTLIKKYACNILVLDNLTNGLVDEIMKKQFNELEVNTDFIIRDNKIIIEIFN
jgi:hypothetical protein